MLNYIITVAISAFFVPHLPQRVLAGAASQALGDIIGGIVVVIVLGLVNIVGAKEAAGPSTSSWRLADFRHAGSYSWVVGSRAGLSRRARS